MYCPKCGNVNDDGVSVCVSCGEVMTGNPLNSSETVQQQSGEISQKSKVVAGLLGIFLGSLGIHNFYLGFTQKAIIQLVVSLVGAFLFGVGPVVMGIWGLVEGILYLTGSKNTDANGNILN